MDDDVGGMQVSKSAPSLEGAEARQGLAAARVLRVQPVQLGAQVRQHHLHAGWCESGYSCQEINEVTASPQC